MGLSIKNEKVEKLARDIARRHNISITSAILRGLEIQDARDKLIPRNVEVGTLYKRLMKIADEAAALPDVSDLTEDEILGYDEFGIPTR